LGAILETVLYRVVSTKKEAPLKIFFVAVLLYIPVVKK